METFDMYYKQTLRQEEAKTAGKCVTGSEQFNQFQVHSVNFVYTKKGIWREFPTYFPVEGISDFQK